MKYAVKDLFINNMQKKAGVLNLNTIYYTRLGSPTCLWVTSFYATWHALRLQSIANPTSGNVAGYNGRKAAERAFCGGCVVLCVGRKKRRRRRRRNETISSSALSELPSPSSCSSYDESRECTSLAVDPNPHDATRRGWALLFVYRLQNRAHHKIIGRTGRAWAETRNVTVNRQKRPNNEVAFLVRAIGSLVDPLRTVEIIKFAWVA